MIEAVQKFACKVCLHQWRLDYRSALCDLHLLTLETRRLHCKLVMLFKIYYCIAYSTFFPSLKPKSSMSTRNQFFDIPFITNSNYYHSFLPSTCRYVNNSKLSIFFSSQSLSDFKFFIHALGGSTVD